MLKVFEAFSGIGSQAKALENAGIDHEIFATADWDVTAIIAYDLIHHGRIDRTCVDRMSIDEVDHALEPFTFSLTGKKPTNGITHKISEEARRTLLAAIRRSKNRVSITDIKGYEVPDDIDLLTYSFPCQDLSLCKFWHGDVHGIDRAAHTRSGMLWEIERILLEMSADRKKLPRFLLMENVTAILNDLNKKNFAEWRGNLENLGYLNIPLRLNAKSFGIPQMRERAYMISIRCDHNIELEQKMSIHFSCDPSRYHRRDVHLRDVLRLDYSNDVLRSEADESQPNETVSRDKIFKENVHLLDENYQPLDIAVNTITTKQDRNPNSGVIAYPPPGDSYGCGHEHGASFRNLTPRECFMLMGFEERDYEVLIENNIRLNSRTMLFTRDKLNKLAGNSIVVDVLECLFKMIDEANSMIKIFEAENNG